MRVGQEWRVGRFGARTLARIRSRTDKFGARRGELKREIIERQQTIFFKKKQVKKNQKFFEYLKLISFLGNANFCSMKHFSFLRLRFSCLSSFVVVVLVFLALFF